MIEFTVPLPRQGIQHLNSKKNKEASKVAQWWLRESVLDALQAQSFPLLTGRLELRLTSRSNGHSRADGRYRPRAPWMVGLYVPYVLYGLYAAPAVERMTGYQVTCAVEPVDSLADEGIHVRVSAVRPIEEEADA